MRVTVFALRANPCLSRSRLHTARVASSLGIILNSWMWPSVYAFGYRAQSSIAADALAHRWAGR